MSCSAPVVLYRRLIACHVVLVQKHTDSSGRNLRFAICDAMYAFSMHAYNYWKKNVLRAEDFLLNCKMGDIKKGGQWALLCQLMIVD